MDYSIDGIKNNIQDLDSAIENNNTEKIYELLTLSDRMYGNVIPSVSDSFEEVKQYSGTLVRNAKVIASILKEYVKTHACVCFPEIECSDYELNKLVQSSITLYNNNEMSLATEKIWDAFERLKTYYSPALSKATSANKIIDDMSASEPHFKELYETEFKALTDIGNGFRIRHHETTKIDIIDNRYYDYFYKRCLALISVATLYLVGGANT